MNFRGMTNKYLPESWHSYIDRILDPLLKIELIRQSVIDAISAIPLEAFTHLILTYRY